MITRKLGKILRGKATPFQIFMACFLGMTISFIPSASKAPGLVFCVTALLIILNANLAVAAMIGILGKLLSLAIAPVSFQVGVYALDGPTQGLFKKWINGPVTAWFGFEYPLVTGSLILGMLLGVFVGIYAAKTLSGFRRKMADAQENSERYKKWSEKKVVRFLVWVFFGKGKVKDYADVLQKKVGNPIRVMGVVFVAAVCLLIGLVVMFMSGPIVHNALQEGLQQANGATVEIGSVETDAQGGKVIVRDLAMADPDNLDTDLLRAEEAEADVAMNELLSKKVVVDRLLIQRAKYGEKRLKPGVRNQPKEEPAPPPTSEDPTIKTIDDYLEKAEEWKEKLKKVEEWKEKLEGPEKEGADGKADPDGVADDQSLSWRERLEAQVAKYGYGGVRADHLIEGSPRVLVKEVVLEEVEVPFLGNETISINGLNWSSNPRLVIEPPSVNVASGQGTFNGAMALAGASLGGGKSTLDAFYKGILVDSFADQLKVEGVKPLSGGTMDVQFDGAWPTGEEGLDMLVNATLFDTTITLAEGQSAKVSELMVPLEVTGSLGAPMIKLDSEKLADALVKAGAAELANRVRAEAEARVGKAVDEATDKLKEKGGELLEEKGGELIEKVGESVEKQVGEDVKKEAEKVTEKVTEQVGEDAKKEAEKALKKLPFGKKKDD